MPEEVAPGLVEGSVTPAAIQQNYARLNDRRCWLCDVKLLPVTMSYVGCTCGRRYRFRFDGQVEELTPIPRNALGKDASFPSRTIMILADGSRVALAGGEHKIPMTAMYTESVYPIR